MTSDPEAGLTVETLRRLAAEYCEHDPGDIDEGTPLGAAGLTGFDLLRLVTAIEDLYAVAFPADLLTAFETVGDLLHFTRVKAGHA